MKTVQLNLVELGIDQGEPPLKPRIKVSLEKFDYAAHQSFRNGRGPELRRQERSRGSSDMFYGKFRASLRLVRD
jgi:hypothetical protein